MFGHERAALLGADVEVIVPERFRAAHRAQRTIYHADARIRTIDGELMGQRADGTEFPVDIRIGPLGVGGSFSPSSALYGI